MRKLKLNNYMTFMIIGILSMVTIVGCTIKEDPLKEPNTIAVGEPNPSTPGELPIDSNSSTDEDLASGTSPKMSEESAKAMQVQKSIDDIVKITLKDLEGNIIKDDFSDAEIQQIVQSFNDSFIMDTAYIEMITGYTMEILLSDDQAVFIHSYGDPTYIVASNVNGETYHLGCEFIGNMLLNN